MEDGSSKWISIKLGDETFYVEEMSETDYIREEGGVKFLCLLPCKVDSIKIDHRDISVAVLRSFLEKRKQEQANSKVISKPQRVLQALSGAGFSAIRYAHEVEGINEIVALNEDEASFQVCQQNLTLNRPEASAKVVSRLVDDARIYMYAHPKSFDVVDLDTLGSPCLLLDSAVWATVDGGLLMCSASDFSIFHQKALFAYSKYHSISFRCVYDREMLVRILLACIERYANMHGRYIDPIFSVDLLCDIRVFVRIYSFECLTVKTPLNLSYVYQCDECPTFHLQPLATHEKDKNGEFKYLPGYAIDSKCQHCGGRFFIGGPIWAAPYFQHEWVKLISSHVQDMNNKHPVQNKIIRMLSVISKELSVPLFFEVDSLCETLGCPFISNEQFKKAIEEIGFQVSETQFNSFGVKTDAPMHVVWDVMRCWVKSQSQSVENIKRAGSMILSKETNMKMDFGMKIEPAKKKMRDVNEDLES